VRRQRATIAAVSTAQGEGGIAIVRVSGKLSRHILRSVFRPDVIEAEYESHRMYYGHVVEENGEIVDEVMAVIMIAPHSYTREDVLEIHCHGGTACSEAILNRVLRAGAQMAEPGEFTKRAFLNGRIDLSRAEAVMQLIGARGEAARRASLRQLGGGVSSFVGDLSKRLTDVLSTVEAATDFPEEMEEPLVAGAVCEAVCEIAEEIEEKLDPRAARILREGASVVLAGRPNVGKSSLLNALVRQERAIVTDIPGTTRDVLTERVELNGLYVELSDTAGIRETGDKIEILGVRRARGALSRADVVLLVLDLSEPLTADDRALLRDADERYVLCLNKADLPPRLGESSLPNLDRVRLSAKSGAGVKALTAMILKKLGASSAVEGIFTAKRHIELAKKAAEHLRACEAALKGGIPVDQAADDLWRAQKLLAQITGQNATEDVLDAIFRNFCVGK